MSDVSWYWKERCRRAEDFIHSHAADPDITDEMVLKYSDWLEFKKLEEPTDRPNSHK